MSEKYPEHTKLGIICERSQMIYDFLEWLEDEKGISLCRREGRNYEHIYDSKQALLAEFFEIDLKKIENEKRAMLEEIRSSQ